MAEGGAAGLVEGPLMAQMEGIDRLERGHTVAGGYQDNSEYTGKPVPTPSPISNVEQSQRKFACNLSLLVMHGSVVTVRLWPQSTRSQP